MKNSVNLLFLGGAKRVSMARMFKNAAHAMDLDCHIFSYELSEFEAIACEATVVPGLRWTDPMVDADLRRVIAQEDIHAVIPFVDGAVAVAARLADCVFVPTGTTEQAEQMFDKIAAAEAFAFAGLPIPATYTPGEPSLHLIAKPRHGSASKGIIEIHSLQELDAVLSSVDKYLIQERIDNRCEYTVDCYADVVGDAGVLVSCPRIRLEVAGGEVVKTSTVHEPDIEALAREAIMKLGLRGAVTVQVMRDLDDGRLLLMEINPRLGGGAVCSVAAGAELPALILRQALGMPVIAPQWKAGVAIARYPAETIFYNGKNE